MYARVLKFHIRISNEEIADTYFFLVRIMHFPGLWSFEKVWMKSYGPLKILAFGDIVFYKHYL